MLHSQPFTTRGGIGLCCIFLLILCLPKVRAQIPDGPAEGEAITFPSLTEGVDSRSAFDKGMKRLHRRLTEAMLRQRRGLDAATARELQNEAAALRAGATERQNLELELYDLALTVSQDWHQSPECSAKMLKVAQKARSLGEPRLENFAIGYAAITHARFREHADALMLFQQLDPRDTPQFRAFMWVVLDHAFLRVHEDITEADRMKGKPIPGESERVMELIDELEQIFFPSVERIMASTPEPTPFEIAQTLGLLNYMHSQIRSVLMRGMHLEPAQRTRDEVIPKFIGLWDQTLAWAKRHESGMDRDIEFNKGLLTKFRTNELASFNDVLDFQEDLQAHDKAGIIMPSPQPARHLVGSLLFAALGFLALFFALLLAFRFRAARD